MAKIYETKEDVERDRLSNVVRDANSSKSHEFDVGVGGTLSGLILVALGNAEKRLNQLTKTGASGKFSVWAGIAFVGASAVNFALAFFDNRKAGKAKNELDALSPQEVMLPKDMTVESALPPIVEGEHRFRLEKSRAAELSQGAVKS